MPSEQVHPLTFYSDCYDNNHGRPTPRASGSTTGMSMRQFYLAHILSGMASAPSSMLIEDEYVEKACELAERAERITIKRGWR